MSRSYWKSPLEWFKSRFNMRDHFWMFVSRENLALLTLLVVVEAHKTWQIKRVAYIMLLLDSFFLLTCIDTQHFNIFLLQRKKSTSKQCDYEHPLVIFRRILLRFCYFNWMWMTWLSFWQGLSETGLPEFQIIFMMKYTLWAFVV